MELERHLHHQAQRAAALARPHEAKFGQPLHVSLVMVEVEGVVRPFSLLPAMSDM